MRHRVSSPGWAAVAVAVLSVPAPGRLTAQEQALNAAALFLLFPVGGQSVGTGQTAATLDGTSEAMFYNPAGVSSLSSSEFALHSAKLLVGPTTALTALFPRHGVGVFGVAFYLVDYGDQPVTDSSQTTLGVIASRNFEVIATFGTQLTSAVALGVSYKLIEFSVVCSGQCPVLTGQGVTHALDLGGQFAVGPERALRVGVALRNLGFPLQVNNRDQADPLPTRLVVGAAYRVLLRPAAMGSALDRFDIKLVADVESRWRETGTPGVRVGVDVGYREALRVRGGYAFVNEGLSGPSVGVGLAMGSIGVDLARTFLTGTDLVVPNPTFLSFRVEF